MELPDLFCVLASKDDIVPELIEIGSSRELWSWVAGERVQRQSVYMNRMRVECFPVKSDGTVGVGDAGLSQSVGDKEERCYESRVAITGSVLWEWGQCTVEAEI
ncbi:MAG: hypothetical protein L6R35_001588 [Caloplaca aegaea]|nr:MAG: hypothetical protein L6R35_001588 [Caloplaca aegaea]